jgi:2,3,4,5-tetrahydropyridine-2-carboxylate N-succinyltransferase
MKNIINQHKIDRINTAFDDKTHTDPELNQDVNDVLDLLDAGSLRVCEKIDDQWITHQWIKKAILLSFRLNQNKLSGDGAPFVWYDKVPLKTELWDQASFASAGFRSVPGAVIRRGAFVERNAILMPSFVNIGAYVGAGTLIDTWATV